MFPKNRFVFLLYTLRRFDYTFVDSVTPKTQL